MKKISPLLFTLALLSFISCEKETANAANPTNFLGKVVLSDTGEPFAGSIKVTGYENRLLAVSRIITSKRQTLDAGGEFEILVDGNEEIDRFVITISDPPENEFIDWSVNCGDLDCNLVPPGKVYDDLLFEMTPEE